MDEDFTVSEETVLCAFDYALGRGSYIVSSVVRDMTENAYSLSQESRRHIIKKITDKDTYHALGHEQDAAQWHGLRDFLNEIEAESQA